MFVVDTNVVSELRKVRSGTANAGVAEWVSSTRATELFISAVTIHELEHGVLLMERSDARQGAVLRAWLDESVATAFADRVLPIDEPTARRSAGLHVPDPAPFRDSLIGASALVHGMCLVTRNVKNFERFGGLDVINPWT